jgi:hypothetical protein
VLLPTDFIIRQDGKEFRAPDLSTLRLWAKERRVRPESQVFHPKRNQWSRAQDMPELEPEYRASLNVANLAKNYRALVLGVGVQILFTALSRTQPDLALFVLPVLLVTIGALTYYAYQTAKALGADIPVLWAVAMFIPCVNVITLLVLSSKAQAVCRANGIPVGFFGPKVS